MADDPVAEIQRRASAAIVGMVQAAGQMAQLAIELRVAQLQRAARASDERARQIRAQTRAANQADAAVWRAANRPGWWRRASPEDISQVWRAASTWSAVDPRAEQTRRRVAERLAERGVHVDPDAGGRPGDAAWLADALDRTAVEQQADDPGQVAAPESGPAGPSPAERREEMAAVVRSVWPAERADRVIGCEAWPALAYRLDQLRQQGHDVEDLLRSVPPFVDRAHTPAAFAFRVVDDRVAGRIDLGTQDSAGRTVDQPGRAVVAAASAFPASTESAVAGAKAATGAGSTQAAQRGTAAAVTAKPIRADGEVAGR